MSKIDERIVELRFNTSDFERGVKATQDGLRTLNNTLSSGGGIADGVQNISSKFNAFGAIAFSALQRLTNSAIDFGARIGRALIDPLVEGGRRRAMNMEQARFQFKGLGMDVEQSMEDALYAVKGTAYGLDEAAMAASMFGASGIESGEQMQTALRGIAGVAAMSGSSYTDMANVFTKVAGQGRVMGDDLLRLSSRGMNAAATLADYMNKTGDWADMTESKVRDMVTKGEIDFELFSAAMSDAFGEHATKASETFSGALANVNAALARIGEMYWAPALERSRQLFNAITPVIDGVATAVEPLIAGFSRMADTSFDNIIQFIRQLGFADATADFTPPIIEGLRNIGNTILGFARPIFQAWQQVFPPMAVENVRNIGDAVLRFSQAIKPSAQTLQNWGNTFKGVFAVIGIVWEVLKALTSGIVSFVGAIFPATGGILSFTGSIGELIFKFYEALKSGDGLTTFFQGLGKVLAAPVKLILNIIKALFGFSSATASVMKSGIEGFFEKLGQLGGEAGEALSGAGEAIRKAFGRVVDFIQGAIGKIGPAVSALWEFLEPVREIISDLASSLGDGLKNMFENLNLDSLLKIVNTGVLAYLGTSIAKFFKSFSAKDGSKIGGAIDSITGFFDKLKGVKDEAKDAPGAITQLFDALTPSLEALQNNIKAKTLITIAGAIALLTASVLVLSTIDPGDLTSALVGMTVMFGQLMGALTLLSKVLADKALLKLPVVAAGLVLLAGAMALLSVSVLMLSTLDWNGLAKGLTGVVALLGAIAGFLKIMPAGGKGLFTTGLGMMAVAGAIAVLAISVKTFAEMSWGDLAKGMAGVAAGLLVISGAMRIMPTSGMLSTGVGLIAVSAGLLIMSNAVKNFAGLSWGEIGTGMTALAGSLVIVAGALRLMPTNILMTAAGLVVLGTSLKLIGDAVRTFGSMSIEQMGVGLLGLAGALVAIAGAMHIMPKSTIVTAAGLIILGAALRTISDVMISLAGLSWGEIGRGLVGLAGALVSIAIAMTIMPGNLIITSVGMVILAEALTTLSGVMTTFGGMSWEEIAKGLLTLAGSLLVLAGGMYLMTGALPGAAALIVVAGALSVLAPVIVTLGGLSWGEIAKGLLTLVGAFAVLGVTGLALAAVTPILIGLGVAISLMGVGAMATGAGLLAVATGLTAIVALGTGGLAMLNTALKMFIGLIPTLLSSIAQGIVDSIGVFASASGEIMGHVKTLVLDFLETVSTLIPAMLETGVEIIQALLEGIRKVIPDIIKTGVELLTALLEGIREVIPDIIETAVVIVEHLVDAFLELNPTFVDAGLQMLMGIIEGLTENIPMITEAVTLLIVTFMTSLTESADKIATAGTMLLVTFLDSMSNNVDQIMTSVGMLITNLINSFTQQRDRIIAAGTDSVVAFIQGLTNSISRVVTAGTNLVVSLLNGIANSIGRVVTAATNVVVSFLRGISNNMGRIVEQGTTVIVNFIRGISNNMTRVVKAGADAIVQFMRGLEREIPRIARSATSLIVTFMREIQRNSNYIVDQAFRTIITFINGLTRSINQNAGQLRTAGQNLAIAIINGLSGGLLNNVSTVTRAARTVASNALNAAKRFLGIQSPSKEFAKLGSYSAEGYAKGLRDNRHLASIAGESIARASLEGAKKVNLGHVLLVGTALEKAASEIDTNPVIRPVLDGSDIMKDAKKLPSLMPDLFGESTSLEKAASISRQNNRSSSNGSVVGVGTSFGTTFIQNNHSPKALNESDIYRQTNSLIAIKGGGAGVSVK